MRKASGIVRVYPFRGSLTSFINFYDKMTDLVDERRAADTVSFLDSRQKLSPIRWSGGS